MGNLRSQEWKPQQYIARGDMPGGISWAVWVEDRGEMVGDGQTLWRWKAEVFVNGIMSEAYGQVETSEKAMHSAWESMERLIYAFCAPAEACRAAVDRLDHVSEEIPQR